LGQVRRLNDQLAGTFFVSRNHRHTTNAYHYQLPVATELMEDSYSGESEQLLLLSDRPYLVTEESLQLERAQQQCQTDTDNPEAENNLKSPSHTEQTNNS
ncbi:MAG: hypothetical protein HC773_28990, partial [Scytonema sp. CRU_2_7]|nr:hypothetical protein [Scytonema sp. CRU_2_7]